MSYVVPKRNLTDTDLLHPDLLNEDFVPAAENASGYINEHNIAVNAIPESKLGEECFSKQYYDIVVDNAAFGSGIYPFDYAVPDPVSVNGVNVSNTGEWELLTDMSESVSSGGDVLHIWGWAQYCQQTWSSGANLTAGALAAGLVQFGIRVDGVVYDYTGTKNLQYKTFYPVRAAAQRTTTVRLPGPASQRAVGYYSCALGAHANAVFIETLIPVAPGTHLVELVARRPHPPAGYRASTDYIRVYSRKLYIEQLWQWPAAVSTFDGVSVVPFESEDTVSAASLGTNAVNAVRTKLNAVTSGMVRRGSLTHEHVNTSVLYDSAFATIDGVSYTDTGYPGYNISTVAGARGIAGWWPVEDGAGNLLRTDTTHAAAFDIDGKNCVICVDVELNVQSIAYETGGASTSNQGSFGFIAIGYRSNGTTTIAGVTEAFFNHHAPSSTTAGGFRISNECIVVKTFLILDYRSSLPGFDIDWFQVYASTACCFSGVAPILRWSGGCINVQIKRY